jgi:hypothetical protein
MPSTPKWEQQERERKNSFDVLKTTEWEQLVITAEIRTGKSKGRIRQREKEVLG